MKKLRLFGMFALTFALVFGAASCKQDAGPSGTPVKEVLENGEDLSGTWKITSASINTKATENGVEQSVETTDTAKAAKNFGLSSSEFTFTKAEAKKFFGDLAADVEEINNSAEYLKEMTAEYEGVSGVTVDADADFDARFVANGDNTKLTYWVSGYSKISVKGTVMGQSIDSEMEQEGEIEVVFEKQ